ncbi:NHL repeat-containing protein [candidate division KSB1 bacterium]
MKRLPKRIIAVLLFLSLLSCGKGESPEELTYNTEVNDGVKHIHNFANAWGENPGISIELVRKIGDIENTDENFMFFFPIDVCVDKENNLYILDRGNCRIQKYDEQFNFIRTIGSKGPGPGEMNFAASLDIDSEGNLHVMDSGNMRIEIYNPDGKSLMSFRPDMKYLMASRLFPGGGYITQSLHVIPIIQKNLDFEDIPRLDTYDEKGRLVKSFGSIFDFGDEKSNLYRNGVYFTVDNDSNVIVTFMYLNRIEKYSKDGELFFRTDRPLDIDVDLLDLRIISSAVESDSKNYKWVSTLNRKLNDKENISYGEGDAPGGGMAAYLHKSSEVTETDVYELEIFNSEGILQGKIPIDYFCDNLRIFGDRLFVIDTFRAMCVYEYRITYR